MFLSHSTKDDDYVAGAVVFFQRFGVSVYADNLDASFDGASPVQAAVTLRRRIAQCPRFMVLVSANSRLSRWIPWELGLADERKAAPYLAALPPFTVEGVEESWASQEYFRLYPVIAYRAGEWRVVDPTDCRYWLLERWLKGNLT